MERKAFTKFKSLRYENDSRFDDGNGGGRRMWPAQWVFIVQLHKRASV